MNIIYNYIIVKNIPGFIYTMMSLYCTGYQPDKHICSSVVTAYFFRNKK